MTEIKLEVENPRALLAMLREMLPVNADDINPDERPTIEGICAQIEKQVKPAIEEPLDFGSLVRASNGARTRVLWQQAPHIGGHYWINAFRDAEPWSELTDVEVLRVGLGDDTPLMASDLSRMSIEANAAKLNGEREAYANGARDVAARIHERLLRMLDTAITSERKNALEKAIQAVEELAP